MPESLSKERLLLVGSYPPPFGGVSSLIKELEKALATKVGQFYVLQFDKSESLVNSGPNTIIHKVPNRLSHNLSNVLSLGLGKLLLAFFLLIPKVTKDARLYASALLHALIIASIVRKNNITVVTIFTTRAGAAIPYLSRLIPEIPINYCVFADPYKNPQFYQKHNLWFRDAMLRSRNVFSSSEYCAAVTKIFDVSIKPKVIYVGVDIDRFHPDTLGSESRKKLDLPSEAQIILTVARMETEMGVPAILKIAERVLLGSPNAIFVIAGASGSATPLVEEAARLSGGKLFCRVDVPSDNLPHYYAASTIVIAPTVGVHACMGVSVKEAMAAGKPVIVSNSGGLPEAVEHRTTGVIVPLMDTGEIDTSKFADSIMALMQDPEAGVAMGQKGRLRAEKIFSANATTDSFIKLITDI